MAQNIRNLSVYANGLDSTDQPRMAFDRYQPKMEGLIKGVRGCLPEKLNGSIMQKDMVLY